MKQPDLEARLAYSTHESGIPSKVRIPGTKRTLTLREMHPGTIEKITRIWLERDMASVSIKDGAEVLKDLAVEPYFAFKEAAAYWLNGYFRLRFLWPIVWRIWSWRYTESQMLPIIKEGKKKLPLTAHYETMAYSMDTRTDWMKMTQKEAERYRAEQVSALNQLLSKTSQLTESPSGGSSAGK